MCGAPFHGVSFGGADFPPLVRARLSHTLRYIARSLRVDGGGCDGCDGLLDFRCFYLHDTSARAPAPSDARLHTTASTALLTLMDVMTANPVYFFIF